MFNIYLFLKCENFVLELSVRFWCLVLERGHGTWDCVQSEFTESQIDLFLVWAPFNDLFICLFIYLFIY
jgi:hypothetical protein